MDTEIGKKIVQIQGFYAFIPNSFPPKKIHQIPKKILLKTATAERLLGKLDGITIRA